MGLTRTVYICTVYDCIFGGFLAKYTVHTPYICVALAKPMYLRYFWQGDRLIYSHIRCIYTDLVNPRSNVFVHGCCKL